MLSLIRNVAAAATFLSLVNAAPTTPAPNPTVTIASGVVIGTATRVSNQPSVTALVNAYLGVPFADKPVRFAPPQPAPAFGTINAQTNPPACLQQFLSGEAGEKTKAYFNNPFLPPPPESEDCLYLNVFAPQGASPSNLKPVFFWIYGGNLEFGTASLAYYNGSSLAVNEDIVVVAINYRTNVFGFSNSPEIPAGQQNSGFLDQRFALQWVQDNIRAFGGDPTKVTIAGESAGGFSVKQLLALPPSPQPFRAAIMESQGAMSVGNSVDNYNKLAAHFNCTTGATLPCLRAVPGQVLLDYTVNQTLLFFPAEDNVTSTGKHADVQINSGQFASVPILIGTNSQEFNAFASILGLNTTGSEAQALTDLVFTCPTQLLSSKIASAGRQPVWRYLFKGAFPNVDIYPGAGAYHSVEIAEVFGTYPLVNQLGSATADQIALSKAMQGIWAGFVKNPSAGPGWPKLGSTMDGKELGVLGGSNNPQGEYTEGLFPTDLQCLVDDPVLILGGSAYKV